MRNRPRPFVVALFVLAPLAAGFALGAASRTTTAADPREPVRRDRPPRRGNVRTLG